MSILRYLPYLLGLILILVLVYIAFKPSIDAQFAPRPLAAAELRDYQGQKLSSVYDFRENSIKGPQHIDIANYTLEVTGMVRSPKNFTYREVVDGHTNYSRVVTLNCVEGWSVTILWEGVRIEDLLNETGIDPNAKYVTFYAYDGYSTSFPLSYILDNHIMIAFKQNGQTMLPERGFPFQLVAENKWGYKWIKWVTKIELTDQPGGGYWESRGYSEDGSLNRSFMGGL
ncbi:MAG TPA: molybdopterin-dependent oxidoreductase [Methanocella sp.]|nr:molybdopterin-dependent oxidoreductase [Methanocella sp.]